MFQNPLNRLGSPAARTATRNERRVMLGMAGAPFGWALRVGDDGAVGSFGWGMSMRDVLGFLFLLYVCACVAVASPFFIDLLLG